MRLKSQKDFYSGLMFTITGGAFAIGATGYTVGEGARMGPGYFPLMLGLLLVGIGLFVILESLTVDTEDGERIGPWAWKPLAWIIGANVLFGVLLGGIPKLGIPPMGLVLAIYGLTFLAALAGEEFKVREVAGLATVLAIGSYLAFVVLLRLQFPVWPTFLIG